jgi:hypothetical protein
MARRWRDRVDFVQISDEANRRTEENMESVSTKEMIEASTGSSALIEKHQYIFPIEDDIKKGLKINIPKNPKIGDEVDVEIPREINTLVITGSGEECGCTILPGKYKGIYDPQGYLYKDVYVGNSQGLRYGEIEEGDILRYYSGAAVSVKGLAFLREPGLLTESDISLCKSHSDDIPDVPRQYLYSRRCCTGYSEKPLFSNLYDDTSFSDEDINNSHTPSFLWYKSMEAEMIVQRHRNSGEIKVGGHTMIGMANEQAPATYVKAERPVEAAGRDDGGEMER